jgi:hypothetical protein
MAVFVSAFAAHDALAAIGQDLVASIRVLRNPDVSPATAFSWWTTWQELVGELTELALPLRLLGAAARYLQHADVRELLMLPSEERRIVMPLLGIEEK